MGVSRHSRVPERITRPDERFDSSQVGPSVPYCELFAGRFHCKEPSDYTAKFIPITCGRPTQPDARINVSSLSPTYRSTLMVNSLEPNRIGISQ